MALICHCNVVRERIIVKTIRHGASDVDEVGAECGAGARCGGCRPEIERLLVEHAPATSVHHVRRANALV